MKRFFNWQVMLGLVLIALSAAVYFIHYIIFRDARHIILYLIGDIAFVFIEVLLVTLVIHGLLEYRDKKSLLNKLNMVIGAFYSEVGTPLMRDLACFDRESFSMAKGLVITNDWSDKKFSETRKAVLGHTCGIDCKRGNLPALRDFLVKKRDFLLALMENPNLLEHESFTNLLWAVFHLTEELSFRTDLSALPEKDYEHLAGDIKRAYNILVAEWLSYARHLKKEYPYLFSLAVRTNPFDDKASVSIE